MKYCFSVVSHGQGDLVRELLKDLDRFLVLESDSDLQLVITKNVAEDFLPKSDRFVVTVTENEVPRGFGFNHNRAFELFPSQFFFVINPDIRLDKKFALEELNGGFQQNDIISPVVKNRWGTIEDFHRPEISILNLFLRWFGLDRSRKKVWIAGMFMIFRSSVFRALSGFDQRYYMYVEDCDICRRARDAGYSIGVLETLSVIHEAQRKSHFSVRNLLWHVESLVRYMFGRTTS